MSANNEGSFYDSISTDEVKKRLISLAYETCPDIENLDQNQVGQLIGVLLFYGVNYGMSLAQENRTPPESDIAVFRLNFPEVVDAIERLRTN